MAAPIVAEPVFASADADKQPLAEPVETSTADDEIDKLGEKI